MISGSTLYIYRKKFARSSVARQQGIISIVTPSGMKVLHASIWSSQTKSAECVNWVLANSGIYILYQLRKDGYAPHTFGTFYILVRYFQYGRCRISKVVKYKAQDRHTLFWTSASCPPLSWNINKTVLWIEKMEITGKQSKFFSGNTSNIHITYFNM